MTDPSGRYLDFTWSNLGTSLAPAYRITMVQGPFDASNNPVYTVTYEYNSEHNLWKVHQDPSSLNRTTTFTYTTVEGESGLLASVSDPLGHTVSYSYSAENLGMGGSTPTGTVWVVGISEPASGGTQDFTIATGYGAYFNGADAYSVSVTSNSGLWLIANSDSQLPCTMLKSGAGPVSYYRQYDSDNNVSKEGKFTYGYGQGTPIFTTEVDSTYGPHGNVLTQSTRGFSGQAVTTYHDASKYFQKASVTDANGNTTTFDYYDNQDSNPGNRGEVKWVRDGRYTPRAQERLKLR